MAFERIEPFGVLADELRIARVCATFWNIHRGPNQKAATPRDFSPVLAAAIPEPEPINEADPKKRSALIMGLLQGARRG
jgi:hypothetical protein